MPLCRRRCGTGRPFTGGQWCEWTEIVARRSVGGVLFFSIEVDASVSNAKRCWLPLDSGEIELRRRHAGIAILRQICSLNHPPTQQERSSFSAAASDAARLARQSSEQANRSSHSAWRRSSVSTSDSHP